MGIVTDYLVGLIKSNLEKSGIVVWYDPEKQYGKVAEMLGQEIPVFSYNGSYIELRYKLEPYLDAKEKGNVIVYVTQEHDEVESPLMEDEYFGTYVKPGGPTNRNTRLEVIARKALSDKYDAEVIEGFEKKIKEGILNIQDLDDIASKGAGIAKSGAISLIYDTVDSFELALQFISAEENDPKIEEKDALSEIIAIINSHLGLEVENPTVHEYRLLLQRYILISEFIGSLPEDIVISELQSVPHANNTYHMSQCKKIATHWRERTNLKESYVKCAEEVEKIYGLEKLVIEPTGLLHSETFPYCEKLLINHAIYLIQNDKYLEANEIFESRTKMFWVTIDYENSVLLLNIINKTALIYAIAEDINKEISGSALSAKQFVERYTDLSGSNGWHKLDMFKRRLDIDYSYYAKVETDSIPEIASLIHKVSQIYSNTLNALAEAFSWALIKDNFEMGDLPLQRSIFSKSVSPKLSLGKAAYFWVDALSYELGVNLYESLTSREKNISFALATPPTITQVGMPSLLPGADSNFSLVADIHTLAVKINDDLIKNREDRIKYLEKKTSLKIKSFKLGSMPESTKKLSEEIKDADLILVTSQEIDVHANENNKQLVRKIMEDTLEQIVVSIRKLRSCGVTSCIISSDHGHLFWGELGSDMKIDPPGGETLFLDRRCWIGNGGTTSKSYFRVKPDVFGIKGDFEFAFPNNIACFKAGGGLSFMHGGLSLQEFIIPVIECELEPPKEQKTGGLGFKLVFNKQKVTNIFFSLEASFHWKELICGPEEYKVKLEVRAGNEKGKLISSNCDFDHITGEVNLKKENPCLITLQLPENIKSQTVSVYMLDAETSKELAKIENIEISLLR